MAGETLHEDRSILGADILDRHRAISSLMEELEAIDWYGQRIQGSDDAQLRAILTNNRDEEKEHAAMVLEWLRRHDPALDRQLRTYLFTEGPIHDLGATAASAQPTAAGAASAASGSLGIGSLGIGSLRARG
jgi:ferritin-like protein